MSQNNIPVSEIYWNLVRQADRKFARVRDSLDNGKKRNDPYFTKVFNVYTKLWKFQMENRQKLVEAGLKRWEIGEIASRIAQLYYGQYLRTSDANSLSESFIFYEAILNREYFKESSSQDLILAFKQLRCITRFLIICLLLNRREVLSQLIKRIKALLDECKKNFLDADFREWKQVFVEILRFLKIDTTFMNIRPLRYSVVLDDHPDSLPQVVSSGIKRGLRLQDAILCSYRVNEVKITELTLDTFRMLQCLEWEPSGSYYRSSVIDNSDPNEAGSPTRSNYVPTIMDFSLPPNPRKVIIYRPYVAHFIAVLATMCEELPSLGIVLIYLSAEGKGILSQVPLILGNAENIAGTTGENFQFQLISSDTPNYSPMGSSKDHSQDTNHLEEGLWLGSYGNGGSSCLCPCDLIPFTRRPLFLIVDSHSSHKFKVIHGAEMGETAAMLLSPISKPTSISETQNGCQFTTFLTTPLQAFCLLLGFSVSNDKLENYKYADKVLSSLLTKLGLSLATCNSLHPVWVEVLGDPMLRRFLLRFIFCRAVLALYSPTFNKEEYLPQCLPPLPESVAPFVPYIQSAIQHLANVFDMTCHFIFSDGIVLPNSENELKMNKPEAAVDEQNGSLTEKKNKNCTEQAM